MHCLWHRKIGFCFASRPFVVELSNPLNLHVICLVSNRVFSITSAAQFLQAASCELEEARKCRTLSMESIMVCPKQRHTYCPTKNAENTGLGMLTESNTTQNRVAFFSHFRGKGVSCKSISFLGDQSTAALTQESDAKCEGRSPQC